MYYRLCILKHRLTLLTSQLSSEYDRYQIIILGNCIFGATFAPAADAAIAYFVTAAVLNVRC
jgi:hypothetical protein